jgi:hypothetical protein
MNLTSDGQGFFVLKNNPLSTLSAFQVRKKIVVANAISVKIYYSQL